MKTISLWQPWATLVVLGAKQIETRSWPTRYRGPLAIHASQKWNTQLWNLCQSSPFHEVLTENGFSNEAGDARGLPLGCILGTVNVEDCYCSSFFHVDRGDLCLSPQIRGDEEIWISRREQAFGDYSPGRWGWLLSNPVMLPEPIPYRGRQGLFDVPDHLFGATPCLKKS
jgi:activating signal cointegrator 1